MSAQQEKDIRHRTPGRPAPMKVSRGKWAEKFKEGPILTIRSLLLCSLHGNNDVFVTIQLGKEKYQTSTIKNALNPEWFEECDLPITHMGLEIEVSVYHRGLLSDDFLGYAAVPLWEYKITETAASRWVSLRNKPAKPGPDKYRGELEVKLTFRSQQRHDSMSQAIKKRSPSIRNLTNSIGDKIKFARSRSFRENRRETDIGKMDKCHSFVGTDSGISDQPQTEALTRSYSMSTAYIKTMSLDRKKRLDYSVRSNITDNSSSQNVAAATSSPGIAETYSQSLYSLPVKRRSSDVPFNRLPPPPYDLKVSPKDDSASTPTANTANMSNTLVTSAFGNSLSSDSSQLEPIRLEFSGIYESIKEKTEPENTVSSSSDPESVPMPKIRGKRFSKRQPVSMRSRNQEYLKDSVAASQANRRENTSDQQPFSGNGRDSGILDDRSSGLGNSLEGSLAAIDGANSGSKVRGPSGIVDAHTDHGKTDVPRSSTPVERGLLYHLDREMYMAGSVRPKKAVSPPSIFYSQENKQGELVVRKRSRGQRDRDRNRLLQIKQSPSGLYDDSVSEPSDGSSVPDDLLSVFKNMSREELLRVVITSKAQMIRKDQYIRDLENYIDDLLVRVMETTPRLLTRQQPIHRF